MKTSLKSLVGASAAQERRAPESAPEEAVKPPPAYRTAQTRSDTRQIAGHFRPEVAQALRLLAAEQDKDNQELLAEALTMLFKRYGKPITVEVESGRRKKR